jgi:hypothetical protein
MKLKNTAFNVEMYECGLDKYDTITASQGQTAIVVRKISNGERTTLTVYPFRFSKWRLINILKFAWIRVRVFFNFI